MFFRFPLIIFIVFVVGALLAACGSFQTPAPPATLSPDQVATEVSRILTSTPQEPTPTTPPEEPTPTVTLEPATATLPPPTDTPVPTATETLVPTATTPPTATTTPIATDPRNLLGNPNWRDRTFAEGRNWPNSWTGSFTNGDFIDGKLVMTSVGSDGWVITWPQPENYYIEMTVATGTCAGNDRYGLMVHVPEKNDRGYQLGFSCDGKYVLRLWDPDAKRYTYLVNWTSSAHINAGSNQTNRVGLMIQGDRFTVYANGHLLREATDDTLTEGRFGPWVGHDKTENFQIFISEIAYWNLP
jgi:hypothetical protein